MMQYRQRTKDTNVVAPTPQGQQYQQPANSGTRWANTGGAQAVAPANRNPPPRVNSAAPATSSSGGLLRKVFLFVIFISQY